MPHENAAPSQSLAPSIRARMIEVSATRFIRLIENLTKSEIEASKRLDLDAWGYRHNRIEGKGHRHTIWLEREPQWAVYAWAMHPDCDVFADLLQQDASNGAVDRARLPGVSVEDVEERIRIVNEALAARLGRIEAPEMKRERGR